MPRLVGYRERLHHNVFDSLDPWEMCATDVTTKRMFGYPNIGKPIRTNMEVANCLAADRTFVITSWYARTNLSGDGLAAFANATVVSLLIGNREYLQLSLRDLLNREPTTKPPENGVKGYDEEDLAALPYVKDLAVVLEERHPSTRLTKQAWMEIAAGVEPCHLARPLIVPVRQNFQVNVSTDASALSHMVETTTPPPPQGLVWVHLDGLLSRDIA